MGWGGVGWGEEAKPNNVWASCLISVNISVLSLSYNCNKFRVWGLKIESRQYHFIVIETFHHAVVHAFVVHAFVVHAFVVHAFVVHALAARAASPPLRFEHITYTHQIKGIGNQFAIFT